MKTRHRFLRKSYAMHRMALAIERAIVARTGKEKERAARWAAAWGLLCGINTRRVRLRPSEVKPHPEALGQAVEQITIPPLPSMNMENRGGIFETDTAYCTSFNSISNTRPEFGGIGPWPAAP